jgi:rhodanese-related sulfurtransferase
MQENTVEVPTITPQEARAKLDAGAKILDVREYPEWVERHIPGAKLVPLGDLKSEPQRGAIAPEVLTLCRTGRRATDAAQLLAEHNIPVCVIEGGIEGWQNAGHKTQRAQGGPISMERQVRIGAGVLVLLGLLVPKLRFVSWFVPCGLIFAGITDYCGMAKVLGKAPWNQPRGDEKRRSCDLANDESDKDKPAS